MRKHVFCKYLDRKGGYLWRCSTRKRINGEKALLQHFCKVLEGNYVDNRVINGAQYIIMIVVCHDIAGIVNEAVSVENYADVSFIFCHALQLFGSMAR